ncbi:MAG: SpoIIE family protein phosphatase [Chthoniobacteraceae bacterium]
MSEETPATPGLGKSLKHELRTPLNHIIGYCEMLIEDAQDRSLDAIIPDLERIHTAGRHLLSVINDLFDPDKAPAYRSDPSLLDHEVRTPLNQIIGYAELLQDEAADGSPEFVADLGKIHTAARRLLDQVVEHFGKDLAKWKVPAATAPGSAVASPRASASATSAHTGRILVVDDDAGNREMLSRRLERLGHTVEVAENGRRALEILRQQAFDLMLLDLQMPELNGYEVLEQVKVDEALRDLPIIVLSASDETSRVAHCIEMGAADYLAKPFEPVLLRARIDACLEKKRLRDRERAIQQRLAGELAKAASYVCSLLPAPLAGRVESEWCFQPSEQLGGDAFGHHWIDDDHLAIYLLDVCGHGVGAALLSVSVLNTLRAQTLPGTDFHDPAAVLAALNRAFPAEAQNFFYFTFWYGVYQSSRRELRYSSGGHPPALLLNGSDVVSLATEGASIGCFDNAQFISATQSMEPGARLLVLSDGVFEIFLEHDRVQTWDEFLASFNRAEILAMRAEERLKYAHQLRGAETLEDDFSLLELRFS